MYILLFNLFWLYNVFAVHGQFTPLYSEFSSRSSARSTVPSSIQSTTPSSVQWINHGLWTTPRSTRAPGSTASPNGYQTSSTKPSQEIRSRDPLLPQAARFGLKEVSYPDSFAKSSSFPPINTRSEVPVRKILKCRSADGTKYSPEVCKKMLNKERSLEYLRRPLYSERDPRPVARKPTSRSEPERPQSPSHYSGEPRSERESFGGPYQGPESKYSQPPSSSRNSRSSLSDSLGREGGESEFGSRSISPKDHIDDPSLGIKYDPRDEDSESERPSGRSYDDGLSMPPSQSRPSYDPRKNEGESEPREYNEGDGEDGGAPPPSSAQPDSDSDSGSPPGRNYGSEDTGKYSNDKDDGVRFYTPSAGYDDREPVRTGSDDPSSRGFADDSNAFKFNDEEDEDRFQPQPEGRNKNGFGESPFSRESGFDKDEMGFSKGLEEESQSVAKIAGQHNVTSKGKILGPKDGSSIVLGSRLRVN